MPRATNAKPDPDKVYASWTSFSATIDGVDVTVHEGQRLRGSVPVVQQCFGQFVEDGLPASEKPTTWEVVPQQDAVAAEAASAAELMDIHLAEPPQWYAQPDAVTLNRDRPIEPWQKWHLDHDDSDPSRRSYIGVSHASCNCKSVTHLQERLAVAEAVARQARKKW